MRPRAGPDMVRIHLQIRAEQREAIERLEDQHDLNQGQVIRRLLDLGLAAWPSPEPPVGRTAEPDGG
jgi:hypothetical protein